MEYPINKGIGRTVEFMGLKNQYLYIFAGGLLSIFILFVILYMIGIPQGVCIAIGVMGAALLVWLTITLNKKYDEHGLMKRQARSYHPKYIINRRKTPKLFKQKYEKHIKRE